MWWGGQGQTEQNNQTRTGIVTDLQHLWKHKLQIADISEIMAEVKEVPREVLEDPEDSFVQVPEDVAEFSEDIYIQSLADLAFI